MASGISCVYVQDSMLHSYCGTGMHLNLIFEFSIVHLSQVPCKYNGSRNSIEWFCLLNEILRASAMLPLSGTIPT